LTGTPKTKIRFPKPGNYINFTYVCKAKSDKLFSMKKPDRKESASFSYEDYCSWSEKERWEIIEGEAFNMTPAPGSLHQEISVNLTGLLWLFFRGKACKVFSAPFDVRFPKGNGPDEDIRDVVQPDIAVICDRKKIEKKLRRQFSVG